MRKLNLFLFVLSITFCFASQAAATPVLDFTGIANANGGTWTVGWEFTVNAPLRVTDLGYYDNDGLAGNHDVAIWTTGGALLVQDTILPSDTLLDSFRYSSITPFTLGAGNYIIGGYNNVGDTYIAVSSFTTIPEITFVQGRFSSGGALQFPTQIDNTGAASIFGPNFQADPVPEPATMLLLGTGLAGVAGAARRKKKNQA